jgi:hypothetical protein
MSRGEQIYCYYTKCNYFSQIITEILPAFCKEVGMLFSICSMYKNKYMLTYISDNLYIVFGAEYNPDYQMLVAPFNPCILLRMTIENINGNPVKQNIGNSYIGQLNDTRHLKTKIENLLLRHLPNAEFIKFIKNIEKKKESFSHNYHGETCIQKLFRTHYSRKLLNDLNSFL